MTAKGRKSGASAVICISSHVARGSVGNRAVVFALETLGFPVWSVPTILLPWHPGHAPATRIVPDTKQFSAFLGDLQRAPWLGEVGAVVSGYLGNASQAEPVADLVRRVKAANPQALYLCDPVMGDKGGLYVPEATATAIRDRLMPLADIATPNRYELEWMAGATLSDNRAVIAAARQMATPAMLVTSAPSERPDRVANLLITDQDMWRAEHDIVVNAPNGTGDLTAALFLARLLTGVPGAEALGLAASSVFEVLSKAAGRGADELMLETDTRSLVAPQTAIKVERLDLNEIMNSPAALPTS